MDEKSLAKTVREVVKEELTTFKQEVATKEDLKVFATEEDLKVYANKGGIGGGRKTDTTV